MAFYSSVQAQYGNEAAENLKKLASLNKKLILAKSRRWFLLRCRSKKVYPLHILQNFNCIYNSVNISGSMINQLYKIADRFKHDLLNLEIKITISNFGTLRRETDALINWIKSNLPPDIGNGFLKSQNKFCLKFFAAKNKTLNNKIQQLCAAQLKRAPIKEKHFLVNRTNIVVPVAVEDVLGLSPSVNIPYGDKNLPILDLITDVEMIVGDMENPEKKRAVRSNAATIIKNGMSHYKNRSPSPLEVAVKAAKVFLRDNPEVILVRSDKGKTSVLMSRNEYNEKIDVLLNDDSVYRTQRGNPTSGLQRQCNEMVDRLVTLGCINKWKKDEFKTQNAVPPKIYGLPKCHKEGVPLRPIVSCIGSPGIRLSHLVKDLLAHLRVLGEYDVVNSYVFRQEMEGLVLHDHEMMVSFDVVSLFTNVPLDIVVYLVQRHWSLIEEHTLMPLETFLDLLDLTCMRGYFQHGDQFVRQVAGVAMGGVLSSEVAGLVMVDLLNWVIPQLPFQLRLVKKYVDDLFLVLPRAHVDEALALFNDYHGRLRFTCEREVDGRLPFLDLLLVRDGSGLVSLDWYRKPSASDRCMDFRSAHAFSMKVACARELIGRALRLSSTQYHEDNKVQVKNMLLANGYPVSLVSRLVSGWSCGGQRRARDHAEAVDASQGPEAVQKFYAGLTYVEGVSTKLRGLLEKELPSVKIAFKYNNKISRLHTRLKAADPIQLQSGVVYKVPCKGCSTSYVGHTISYLRVRMARHARDCRGSPEDGTMLSHHAIETGHEFDFDGVTIQDRERKRGRREFKEKLHIMLTDDCCNKRTDVNGISSVYAGILADVKAARS
ncbi:ankyrin 2,3 unc44 [Nesidiocoris tenuis]|uniref:Ankyrin 2,3 unc44 n=1 Tax=Nesidiocoris tenuis TaxID=355587 RepID=A0ABN7AF96_9HEMI|nr:ankyrin 2,3 unc44 [Nesidiocoris tenuis]